MLISFYSLIDDAVKTHRPTGPRVTVGQRADNDIVLNSPLVAPEAALLQRKDDAWQVTALGAVNGVRAGDRPLRPGETAAVRGGDVIEVWPFHLKIDLDADSGKTAGDELTEREAEVGELIATLHRQLLERLDRERRAADPLPEGDAGVERVERHLDELLDADGTFTRRELVAHLAATAVRRECLERVHGQAGKGGLAADGGWVKLVTAVPVREHELDQLVATAARLTAGRADTPAAKLEAIERTFWDHWGKPPLTPARAFEEYLVRRAVKREVKDLMYGYGPLEALLRLPSVSEIMVVDKDRIFVERNGRLVSSGRRFISDSVTEAIIQRIVGKVNRRVDRACPLVDARLTDGSRVNAVLPPLAVNGPCLTVRKFPAERFTLGGLVAAGSLPAAAARFLRACVRAKKNVLVAGGTGTGKTTLLNCLSEGIRPDERVVTIEDTAELQLPHRHVVRLETKPAGVEGTGEYTIRALVKNALRMRPDRIVVGECRGAEALDMLQAMNSGHSGCLTTLHANTPDDVIARLEVLVQMAMPLPPASVHRQIASAVDVVVQLQRAGGKRFVSHVTEFVGVDPGGHGVVTREVFAGSAAGGLRPTGRLPTFATELLADPEFTLETFFADPAPEARP